MWELDYKESWAPKNWCFWTVVLEKTHESPLDCKEIQSVHPKGNQSWVFMERIDIETEIPILSKPDLKRPQCWERLKAGEGDNRGWDGWMASPIQWRWVWVNSRSWWWTGRPGVLQSMALRRVGHDWATELNWTQPKGALELGCPVTIPPTVAGWLDLLLLPGPITRYRMPLRKRVYSWVRQLSLFQRNSWEPHL